MNRSEERIEKKNKSNKHFFKIGLFQRKSKPRGGGVEDMEFPVVSKK